MLIICLSISVNLFLRCDLFVISLLTKGVWFARIYHLFIRACLRIASSRAALNWSNWRLLFSEVIWIILFLTSNINASLHQKSVYNSDMSQYLFFVFYRKLSLLLTSFYENLTTQFLLLQNFESFLVCLLLDQCKKEHKHIKEWAIPKKFEGFEVYFFEKKPKELLGLSFYLFWKFEILLKAKLHCWNSCFGNSKTKNQDPWKFHMIFSWSPLEI